MAATPEDTLIIETSRGPVTVELRPDLAPNHVARIKELARQGFYDGVVFHRVIDGFMAQTGDPTGTGRGGSGQKLRAEFSKEPHTRGAVSMARAQSPDSADSQFFICFDDASFLDGQYTVWGRVSKGMENVDKITRGEPPSKPDKIVDHAGGRRRGLGPRQILVRVDDFDYHLPEELIALRPASPRDAARLLVVEPGADPPFADRKIADLPELLSAGDALVFNDTKVIPAELKGTRERDGSVGAHLGHAHRSPRREPLDGAGAASETLEARRPHRVRRGGGGVPARHSRRHGRRARGRGRSDIGLRFQRCEPR